MKLTYNGREMKVFVAGFVAAALALTGAMPVMPGRIPGDRLIANLTKQLVDKPKSPKLFYLLGRAHFATYASVIESRWIKKGEVEVLGNRKDPDQVADFYHLGTHTNPWNRSREIENTEANRKHISEAIRCLTTSLELERQLREKSAESTDTALSHLTLACTFESGSFLAASIPLSGKYSKANTPEEWRKVAADEYATAFDQAIKNDSKISEKPIFGLGSLISYEAGKSYLRLVPKGRKSDLVRMKLAKLEKVPDSGMITPIVLSFDRSSSIADLLDSKRTVSFDLDGSARVQRYQWVKPTTAFLVWDPMREGRIRSGRQLFGNATWWMLWENGYTAMAALDDNRDGELSGKELVGLALWFDQNGNGKSDSGEVIPIEKTQIAGLSTSSDGKSGDSLVSSSGVRLRDGSSLPSFDWVTSALK
ncbi:MAG: hypothetical protein WCK51_09210 [Armatimonadota bacterium]